MPLGILSRGRFLVVWFVLGPGLLFSTACNSRNALFEHAAAPTAPTPAGGALFGLSLTPTGVMGGTPVTGIVGLTGAAPAGGLLVSLSSNNAAVSVPATVTIPAGADRATFPITTTGVSTDANASIVAATAAGAVDATLGLWSDQPTALTLWYEPSPGGHVVGRRFTPTNATFTLSCSGGAVQLSLPGSNATANRVLFSAPNGVALRPGLYENARSTFPTATGPAFDVGGSDISSCSSQTAQFVVHEAQLGAGTEPLRRLSVTFERTCSTGTMSVRGELRLTNVPYTTFPFGCLR